MHIKTPEKLQGGYVDPRDFRKSVLVSAIDGL